MIRLSIDRGLRLSKNLLKFKFDQSQRGVMEKKLIFYKTIFKIFLFSFKSEKAAYAVH